MDEKGTDIEKYMTPEIKEELNAAEGIMKSLTIGSEGYRSGIYLKLAALRRLEINRLTEEIKDIHRELEAYKLEANIRKELYMNALDRIAELAMKLGRMKQ